MVTVKIKERRMQKKEKKNIYKEKTKIQQYLIL